MSNDKNSAILPFGWGEILSGIVIMMRLKIGRKLLKILLSVLILAGCNGFKGNDEMTISGKISGVSGQQIILEELSTVELFSIDSAIVDAENRFNFSVHPRETGFYLLRFDDDSFISLVLNPDEKLEITINDSSGLLKYDVTGNDENKLLKRYFTETNRRQQRFDFLREEFFESAHHDNFHQIKERIDRELEQLISDQRSLTIKIIEENPGSIASLLLLNQRFANQRIVDIETDFNLFELTDSALLPKYPANSHVLEHHRRVAEFRNQFEEQRRIEEKLSPGQPIPDIALNDVSGKTHRLSDFRGKPVLVYFWVSWSPPCRAANHQIKEIYSQYQSRGLEIFAISLDHQQRFWADAIKVDELPWINVSDLRGMTSPVAKVFNLPQVLPFYFLLNDEGLIIAKGEKFGEIRADVGKLFH
jgi:peroxiredoxin